MELNLLYIMCYILYSTYLCCFYLGLPEYTNGVMQLSRLYVLLNLSGVGVFIVELKIQAFANLVSNAIQRAPPKVSRTL
jgi:hypothetical protein